jgi:hypothetical protein
VKLLHPEPANPPLPPVPAIATGPSPLAGLAALLLWAADNQVEALEDQRQPGGEGAGLV